MLHFELTVWVLLSLHSPNPSDFSQNRFLCIKPLQNVRNTWIYSVLVPQGGNRQILLPQLDSKVPLSLSFLHLLAGNKENGWGYSSWSSRVPQIYQIVWVESFICGLCVTDQGVQFWWGVRTATNHLHFFRKQILDLLVKQCLVTIKTE